MKIMSGCFRLVLAAWLLLAAGCASTQGTPGDPFESTNRAVLEFNLVSDRVFLKPIAQGYDRVFPGPVKTGVRNFFNNLWEPWTAVNDLLQGNVYYAVVDVSRFLINSTVGLLGIFDVATMMDIPGRKEDFGQTLGKWGVPNGPYLVLPFLGPSTVRDTVGLVPQWTYGDPLLYLDSPEEWYAAFARLVDTRARLLGTDELLELQPDQYIFLREAYLQNRLSQVHDGNPPGGDADEDALIDELLGE